MMEDPKLLGMMMIFGNQNCGDRSACYIIAFDVLVEVQISQEA
jgi:hypothetical protein